jgi:hypothetical protein
MARKPATETTAPAAVETHTDASANNDIATLARIAELLIQRKTIEAEIAALRSTLAVNTVKPSKPRKDGPVQQAWAIFEDMFGEPRKAMIDACVAAGINKATASTQHQKWSVKQRQEG